MLASTSRWDLIKPFAVRQIRLWYTATRFGNYALEAFGPLGMHGEAFKNTHCHGIHVLVHAPVVVIDYMGIKVARLISL